MENYREVKRTLLGRQIRAIVHFLDQGINVLLTGGDKSHIGAVSGRIPGQDPVDIELPGHKEGIVARKWAEKLEAARGEPVWVECGIHYETLSREGIAQVVRTCGEMLEELLKEQKNERQ